jgi:hypothetical protein
MKEALESPGGVEKLTNEKARIYGGMDADIADYPFALSLHYVSFHICGASIISVG